jgi:hypothetical protein
MDEVTAAVAEQAVRLFRLASFVTEVLVASLMADAHYAMENVGITVALGALGLLIAYILALVARRVMAAASGKSAPAGPNRNLFTDRIRQRLELLMAEGEGDAELSGAEEKEGSPYLSDRDSSKALSDLSGGEAYDSYHALEDIYVNGSQPDEGLTLQGVHFYADEQTVDYTTDAGYQDDEEDEDEDARTDAMAFEYQRVMHKSTVDPRVLIGWRVSVRGFGTGVVLGTVRKLLSTTKLLVRMEQDDSEVALALQRSRTKGTVPFALIEKMETG